jgi:hypothetical protein
MFNHSGNQPGDVQTNKSKTSKGNMKPGEQFNHAGQTPDCGTSKQPSSNGRKVDPQFNDAHYGVNPK